MRYIALVLGVVVLSAAAHAQVETQVLEGRAYEKVDPVAITERLDALDGGVGSLFDSVGVATGERSDLVESLDVLQGHVAHVQDSLATAFNGLVELEGRVEEVEAAVVTGSNAASVVGRVSANGVLLSGYNLASARTSTGNYTIAFDTPLTSADYAIFIQPIGTTNDTNAHINAGSITASGFSFWLGDADNGAGADVAVDRDFSVMVVSW